MKHVLIIGIMMGFLASFTIAQAPDKRGAGSIDFREGTGDSRSTVFARTATDMGYATFSNSSPSSAAIAFSNQEGSAAANGLVASAAPTSVLNGVAVARADVPSGEDIGADAFFNLLFDVSGEVRASYVGSIFAIGSNCFASAMGSSTLNSENLISGIISLSVGIGGVGGEVQAEPQSSSVGIASAVIFFSLYNPVSRGGAAGDFDLNGSVDQIDITLLQDQVADPDPDLAFDLNGDELVDGDDLDFLMSNILGTVPGDCNLDGMVNNGDMSLLASYFNSTSVWYYGDFDRNGFTTAADFAQMSANWGYGTDIRGANVPESQAIILIPLLLMFGHQCSRTVRRCSYGAPGELRPQGLGHAVVLNRMPS